MGDTRTTLRLYGSRRSGKTTILKLIDANYTDKANRLYIVGKDLQSLGQIRGHIYDLIIVDEANFIDDQLIAGLHACLNINRGMMILAFCE